MTAKTRTALTLSILYLVTCTSCYSVNAPITPTIPIRNQENIQERATVSACLGFSIATVQVNEVNDEKDVEKKKTHSRSACPTGGWITNGDGNRSRCPFCEPAY